MHPTSIPLSLSRAHNPAPYSRYAKTQTGFYDQFMDSSYQGSIKRFYSSKLSNSEASTVISGHLSTIREATDVLARKLGTHADLFMSRWKKLNQTKRVKLLRSIAPHMALNPRHYFEGDVEQYDVSLGNMMRHRTLLLPWMDIETLKSHPHILFALLHYRTQYPPQAWAAFNIKQLDFGWKRAHFQVHFSRTWVLVHGPRYGELVDWDHSVSQSPGTLGFPKAELLFEAQAYLVAVLRDLVLRVLIDVDENVPARTSKWRELTETRNFRCPNEIELWSSSTFPAFSPPPKFELHRVISLAGARLDTVKDHLWQLQCNPAYMRRQLKLFLGTKANSDPKRRSRLSFFMYLKSEVFSYMMWRWIEIECKKIEDLRRRFQGSIQLGPSLPQNYETAFEELEMILVFILNQTGHTLLRDATVSGTLSNWCTIDTSPDQLTVANINFHIPDFDHSKHPLYWDIVHMFMSSGGSKYELSDNAYLFRDIHYHLSVSRSQEKARVNEYMYRWVADLSAFSEILSSLRLGRPQASSTKFTKADRREEWLLTAIGSPGMKVDQADPLAHKLLHEFFMAQPAGSSRDLKWLQMSREIRSILNNFWSSMHEDLGASLRRQGISHGEAQQMLEVITASRSADCKETILAEEAKILSDIEQGMHIRETPCSFTKPYGKTIETTDIVEPSREKIKTRPQGENPAEVIISKELTESQTKTLEPGQAPALVQISKRALNAIELLFPRTPQEAKRGLQWTDFVHAMSDMGFAAQHNGGSAVSFEADGQGRIVFHKPHPESKLAPVVLQNMGGRMNKWFGWKRENFTLDEA
ncbi:hypothetical protein GGR55DRAFT_180431 [Xylaria sp. FL0064]|nr:hypothetical protein GGR55DRAFT_180431 [Xylaria sp. FL0064]